jgi:ribosomal protein S18 acetylase RimI-like enzyme
VEIIMSHPFLDNPGWHALNSHHRHLAIWGDIAVRYPPDILVGASMPDSNRAGFDDLKNLVDVGETIALLGTSLPENRSGWEILQQGAAPQMVCEAFKPASNQVDSIPLAQADVLEMLDLVALAQPGPFLPRTIELGQYIGIRRDGRLVAMAGERLHLRGYCEISAVCTHPDYRRRGYARALTTLVAQGILSRQETPFLHVAPGDHVAINLYMKLGFRLRTQIQLVFLKRLT